MSAFSTPLTPEPEAAKQSTVKPAAKKPAGTSTGGNAKKGTGRVVKFDNRVSFDLPANYKVTDTTDDDGDRKFTIELNPDTDDGEENSKVSFSISVANGEEAGKDILDEIYDKNQDVLIKRKYPGNPDAILLVNQVNMGILGVSLSINAYRLYIRLSADQALVIFRTGVGGDDDSKNKEQLDQLQDVWKTILIDGRKVKTEDFDSEEISAESRRNLDEETKNDEEALDNTVHAEGNLIRIGDRWEMTLPFGWRAKTSIGDDSSFTHLTIYAGTVPSGHCILGNTVGIQKKNNVVLNAMTLEKTLRAAKMADDNTIRDDDRMKVAVSSFVSGDGTAIGRIMVTEKELYGNETQIDIVLTSKIKDMQDAVQKMQDKNFLLGHPFGIEYENNWTGAMRIAASIRPVGEEEEGTALQPRQALYKGITACIPKDLKPLKGGENEADFYYPAKGTPSRKDFEQNEWDYYLRVIKGDGAGLKKLNDRIPSNVHAGMIARHFAYAQDGPSIARIREGYTESGYKGLWLNPQMQTAMVDAVTGDGDQVIIDILTETEKTAAELLRIGKAIYDTIEIDGDSECVCAPPLPPETQVLHEHYDLVTSGQYTTHRDADFVGQSIRELMESHDSENGDAYDEMEIPDDGYTLNKDAVNLAKVFRLNEDLFEPYEDTEAMIREAMFKDARALQALRSLAWSISALADQEGRTPGDYSYEELERIGDIILENNNINYQAFSYCSGLCSHYDWHVFYVPDAYLQGETTKTTDLRYLTGKENRGGNSIMIFGGLGSRSVSDLISRNEETLESLEALRKDLEDLLPVMQTIYNGLLAGRDRSVKLGGPLADALTAWCALAIAAKEPFYSEEAADTPEADAGMSGPLERPTDRLDDKPIKVNTPKKTAPGKTTAKPAVAKTKPIKAAPAKPKGDDLGLNGATVISPGQFAGNMVLKNVVIPEGVTEIGNRAFYSCMFLETVALPKSLRKIDDFAFMSCRALRSVEMPDGIEEIGDHAFGATNSLKQIHLPDSLKKVDRTFLGMGGDSPYATAYLSGTLACRLMEEYNKGNSWPSDALYARRYVIDGVGYEELTDFWKKVKDGSITVKPTASPKEEEPKASSGRKTKTAEKADKIFENNEYFTFVTPEGYEPDPPEELRDPDRIPIRYGKKTSKEGFIEFISDEYTCVILNFDCDGEDAGERKKGETPLQVFNRVINEDGLHKEGFSDIPAIVFARKSSVRVGGKRERVKAFGLAVETDPGHVVYIQDAMSIEEWTVEKEKAHLQHILTIAGGMRVNGEPLDLSKLSPEKLMEDLAISFEETPGEEDGFHQAITFELMDGYQIGHITGEKGIEIIELEKNGWSVNAGSMDAMLKQELSISPGEKPLEAIHRENMSNGGWIRWSDLPESELHLRTIMVKNVKVISLTLYVPIRETPGLAVACVNAGWYDDDMEWNMTAYETTVDMIRMIRVYGEQIPDHGITAEKLMKLLKPDFTHIDTPKGQILLPGQKATAAFPKSAGGSDKTPKGRASTKAAPYNGSIDGFIPEGIRLTETQQMYLKAAVDLLAFQDRVKIVDVARLLGKPTGSTGEGLKRLRGFGILEINEKHEISLNTSRKKTAAGTKCISQAQLKASDWPKYCEKNASIPDGRESIGRNAFQGWKNLETIQIPDSVTELGEGCFTNAENLREVVIPSGIRRIPGKAFSQCTALERAVFPDTLEEIDAIAFGNCISLEEIELPGRLKKINMAAFSNCTGLREIVLPESVEEIGNTAFFNCSSLESIVIPDSVKKMGTGVFSGCTGLRQISLPANFKKSLGSIPESTEVICRGEAGKREDSETQSKPHTKISLADKERQRETGAIHDIASGRERPMGSSVSAGTKPKTAEKKTAKKTDPGSRYTEVTPPVELYSHYGRIKRSIEKHEAMGVRFETRNGLEHEAIPLTGLMERQGKTDNAVYRRLKTIEAGDRYALKDLALRIAQVFRVDQSKFDSRHDAEYEVSQTILEKKWMFSALRSFAWTLADLADREGESIDDYGTDELSAICRFIEGRKWLNYEGGSWFDGLCGHDDIHVYYMPRQMIDDGSAEGIYDVFKYSPIVSLEAFRECLGQLQNPMIRLHNRLLENRDRSEKIESPEAAVLRAWCAMVMSAETSFFSEDGPMLFRCSSPDGAPNDLPIALNSTKAVLQKAASKTKKEDPSMAMNSVASYEIVKGPDGKERIKLGEYPAGEPIVWLVLEHKGNELLLLSEYGLDAKAFSSGFDVENPSEWKTCTLRKWLNGDFYDKAFDETEQAMILEDTHNTYKKSRSGEEETGSVTDRVFLLSEREVRQYFPTEREMICKATTFARSRGAQISAGPDQCGYWLRSPAVEMLMGVAGWTGSVQADGSVKGWGYGASELCARPVIRVKSNRFKSSSSAGTTFTPAPTGQAMTKEEREAINTIKGIADDMSENLGSTMSALEKHAENRKRQAAEKEKRIADAKAKGKSDKDEADMLAVLQVEEGFDKLDRPDDEFAEIYAEDFAAYTPDQMNRLRKKVRPKLHDAAFAATVTEEMMSRPVKDRFGVSTANWFNLDNGWDFKARGETAIAKTRQYYRDEEMVEVRKLMEEHKQAAADSVNQQLANFNAAWSDWKGVRNDLHIRIEEVSEPISERHNAFDTRINKSHHAQVLLRHPSMGYLTIPVMNLFASVWGVTPEKIWNTALNNSIEDTRNVSAGRTKEDAASAKGKALAALDRNIPKLSQESRPVLQNRKDTVYEVEKTPESVPAADLNSYKGQRRAELEKRIRALEQELGETTGILGFMKKKKIRQQIEEAETELKYLIGQ